MASFSVGDVVTVRFPFSDLSQTKIRPALVLADADKGDFILCQITSKAYSDLNAVELNSSSFDSGSLIKISYARPAKLFTANTNIINKTVACIKPSVRKQVVDKIVALLH